MMKNVNKRMQDQFMPESHIHGLTRLTQDRLVSANLMDGIQLSSQTPRSDDVVIPLESKQ